jgi:hypothetical protein
MKNVSFETLNRLIIDGAKKSEDICNDEKIGAELQSLMYQTARFPDAIFRDQIMHLRTARLIKYNPKTKRYNYIGPDHE